MNDKEKGFTLVFFYFCADMRPPIFGVQEILYCKKGWKDNDDNNNDYISLIYYSNKDNDYDEPSILFETIDKSRIFSFLQKIHK